MHIPDGLLDTSVCLTTGAVSAIAVGVSVHRLKTSLADRTVPLTGMVAALVFAGQMVNFPVAAGTSGHLIGGVLAARLLGPWAGCLAITLVLIVQKFLFNDGGLLALGPNIFHMAVVGALGGHVVLATIRRVMGDSPPWQVAGAVLASWLTVMTAALLCTIELSFSHADTPGFRPGRLLSLMVFFHALIGIGESLITGGIIRFVGQRRPELLQFSVPASEDTTDRQRNRVSWVVGLAIALLVAMILSPFASPHPDGLEAALQQTSLDTSDEGSYSVFTGYDMILGDTGFERWSTLVSGGVGTLIVFAIALLLARSVVPRTRTAHE